MLLDKNNLNEITEYLQTQKLVNGSEKVLHAAKPGEGNMNYVLRLTLADKTLIIKQARPYVEKYPSIPAPEERVVIESEFYNRVASNKDLSAMMPAIINIDTDNHVIVLEDLGEGSDYTFIYKPGQQLSEDEATALARFISVLHNNFQASGPNELMANRKLRGLNHEHIFVYPLMKDNGFNLDTIQEGLQYLSMKYKGNKLLKEKAQQLGTVYLKDGNTLLHGDYYPGSWLKTLSGVKVIDPEFCFYGPAEFDLGIMLAHLKMAKQDESIIQTVIKSYSKPQEFSEQLLDEFTGIEIIRRIIGLAQLPLTLTLKEKEGLLEEAMKLLGIQ